MKKLFIAGLSIVGLVGLSGCAILDKITDREKQYQYKDFKELLADRKLSFDSTKAVGVVDTDGSIISRNYTYIDATTGQWEYKYVDPESSKEIVGFETLDVIADAKAVELAAALNNKKPDQIFTFYATSKTYRIAGELENEGKKINIEIKYREDGLATNRYTKTTDLKTIVTTVQTIEYTYSK